MTATSSAHVSQIRARPQRKPAITGLTIVFPHDYTRVAEQKPIEGANFAFESARKLVQSWCLPLAEMLRRASPIADASDKAFEGASGAASSYGLELARKLAFDGADSVLIWDVAPVPSRRGGRTGQAVSRGGPTLDTRAVNSPWQKLIILSVRKPGGRAGKHIRSAMVSSKW